MACNKLGKMTHLYITADFCSQLMAGCCMKILKACSNYCTNRQQAAKVLTNYIQFYIALGLLTSYN